MRHTMLIVTLATLATFAFRGCASSDELRMRAETHMRAAQQAEAAGDHRRAVDEQRAAEHRYQQADARAFEEGRPTPAPPATPAPLPLFDPNMQRSGPAPSQLGE